MRSDKSLLSRCITDTHRKLGHFFPFSEQEPGCGNRQSQCQQQRCNTFRLHVLSTPCDSVTRPEHSNRQTCNRKRDKRSAARDAVGQREAERTADCTKRAVSRRSFVSSRKRILCTERKRVASSCVEMPCGNCRPPRSLRNLRWSGRLDLNQRPHAPQACALPGCATSRPDRRHIALQWAAKERITRVREGSRRRAVLHGDRAGIFDARVTQERASRELPQRAPLRGVASPRAPAAPLPPF